MAAFRWIKNEKDPTLLGPKVELGLFAAGASTPIAKGQLLERTATGGTVWVPIDSDHDATVTKLAIAHHDITSGDPAGFYEIEEFRDGDVYECDLQTASALAPETALYYSTTAPTTAVHTSGSNVLAYSTQGTNHPGRQKRNSQAELGDVGVTFRSTNKVWLIFRTAVSSFSLKQRA